jgi:hypothetical protein
LLSELLMRSPVEARCAGVPDIVKFLLNLAVCKCNPESRAPGSQLKNSNSPGQNQE